MRWSVTVSILLVFFPFVTARGRAGTQKSSPIVLESCSVAEIPGPVKCGHYLVYEDRVHRTGRQIPLNVVVVPALNHPAASDPIFWLEGGPGGASTMSAAVVSLKWLKGLHQDHDIVFVDERGTGKSAPLSCGDIGNVPEDLDLFFAKPFPVKQMSDCRKQLQKKADLRFYTTSVVVDDMNDVRKALGYNRIDLAALSYGTLTAQEYTHRYPNSVRASFLLGVVPPNYRLPLPFARASQRALDLLLQDCSVDENCHAAFPNITSEFADVLNRFDKGDQKVDLLDPASKQFRGVVLSRDSYVEHIRELLYNTYTASFVPYVVHQAYEGNFVPFGEIATRFHGGGPGEFSGLHFSMICSESVPFIKSSDVAWQTRDTYVGTSRVDAYTKVCEDWPRAIVPKRFTKLLKLDTPILIFAGNDDGVVSPEFAESAAKFWPNSVLVKIPNSGHQLDTPCEWGLIETFFRAAKAKGLNTSCVEETRRPAFALEIPHP